jgi:hypothetical protein
MAMIEEFEVSAERGIPIVVVAGARLILDTGSPVSFARTGNITLGGCGYKVPVDCRAGNPNSLSQFLGEPVDGLLGCDLLASRILDLNCPAGRAHVISDDASPEMPCWLANAIPLPVSMTMGVPIAQISVNGRQASAAVDTGASVCFASPHLLEGTHPIGRHDDFHPGIGRFTTALHLASIHLGNEEYSVCLPVAAAPASMLPLLAGLRLAVILGGDLVTGAETLFDFRSGSGVVLLSSPKHVRRAQGQTT